MPLFESFKSHSIEVGDVRIHCKVAGTGKPVLLLHGFPQNHAMWARVAPHLAQTCAMVCADLRGYGDSSKPASLPDSSNYSFRAMALDQVGLMQALGCDRFHVIGHDRGARTAHRMALARRVLRALPHGMGGHVTRAIRSRNARGVPPLLARSCDDPRVVLRLRAAFEVDSSSIA